MGCQSEVILGDSLTFSICTHDPDTGELTDADSAPTYRVYEDETATPILTGTMTTLDAANTIGFYSEQVAGTTANGFEVGKSYTVYIEATVDGDTGGISYGFTVVSAANIWTYETRTLTQSAASVVAAVSGSDLSIKRGDTYTATLTGLTLSGATTMWFTVKDSLRKADALAILQIEWTAAGGSELLYVNGAAAADGTKASLTPDLGAGSLVITIDESVTDDLIPHDSLGYDVQILVGGTVTTVTEADCAVTADVTRAIA